MSERKDRKSDTSYVIYLKGIGVISWKSKGQKIVATSTAEAELIATCEAAKEIVYFRYLLAEIGFPQVNATMLYMDNQAAIKIAENSTDHTRSKHIDIKYYYTRELVEKNIIKLVYIRSNNNLADRFTKPLENTKFSQFKRSVLRGVSGNGGVLEHRINEAGMLI